MIDTVHCYFEKLEVYEGQDVLLPFWERTWSEHGWKTRVLSREDAEKHPLHDSFMEHVAKIPTTNHRDYENSCYRRHLAMALVGDGLMTDYDVINMGFNPSQMPELKDWMQSLDSDGVPCAAFGTKIAWDDWVDHLGRHVDRSGNNYVSDMTLFWLRYAITHRICIGIFKPGWEKAALIHFANAHCLTFRPGIPRLTLMEEFLATGQVPPELPT